MNVLITGATGTVGQKIANHFGKNATIVTRDAARAKTIFKEAQLVEWDLNQAPPSKLWKSDSFFDVVFHLSGESVGEGRWTPEKKARIKQSRTLGTRHLIDALSLLNVKPSTILSASAVGIYGDRNDELLTETSTPGTGFLSEVCMDWEKEAMRGASLGMRVVCLRIGLVLSRKGGALSKMLPAFKLGLGSNVGRGNQWMSWIHEDDLHRLFLHVASDVQFSGACNAVSPESVQNKDFTRLLGEVLHKPTWSVAPSFMIKTLMGEMSELVLSSQRVEPTRALLHGFHFQYPSLKEAFQNLLGHV